MVDINNYFDNKFGFLVLFVLIVGIIGDILIHFGTYISFPFKKPWFAQGLVPYYKSLELGQNKYVRLLSSLLLSGLLGGIACVIGLVFGQLLLYAYESNNKSDPMFTTYIDDMYPKLRHPEWPEVRGGYRVATGEKVDYLKPDQ